MIAATKSQLTFLSKLIQEVEPTMKIPANCSLQMAQARIKWLLKKKANPSITKKQYL